jgi:hypothetical protein
MTSQEIKDLAQQIAIAQLTAADEMIDATTAEWPTAFKAKIPAIGQGTQAERFEAFRAVRPQAESVIAAKAREEAETTEKLAQMERNNAARREQLAQEDKSRFENEQAVFDASRRLAEANGTPFDMDAPVPPRSGEEIEKAAAPRWAF